MALSGQAHGKLLLFGEHAVVHGHPAMGVTLPLSTRIDLKEIPQPQPSKETKLIDRLLKHWEPKHRHDWKKHDWQATITSNVPMSRGYGSSAALTGALARALAPTTNSQTQWQLAHQAEHEFHGTPSGVDTALALANGITCFQKEGADFPTITQLSPPPLCFITGFIPRTTDTHSLVQHIHKQLNKAPQKTTQQLDQLGNITQQAIKHPQTDNLGELAQEAQTILKQLGLSTEELDTILTTAQQAGATGGKLSGAGGGGAFVLFCEKQERANSVIQTLSKTFSTLASTLRCYDWNGNSVIAPL